MILRVETRDQVKIHMVLGHQHSYNQNAYKSVMLTSKETCHKDQRIGKIEDPKNRGNLEQKLRLLHREIEPTQM